jgi:hypothetical protein
MKTKYALFTALFILSLGLGLSLTTKVSAVDIDTSVTVGNTAPVFSEDATCGEYPCESPARYTAAPVNVGDSTTFRATATDANNENYYLIVCKTNVFNASGGGAPTCDTNQTICVSSSTANGAAATCNYEALQTDLEETAWYARVCDNNSTDQLCSVTSQGNTGQNEASPLVVNHAPTITSVTNDASTAGTAKDPGQNVTWTTVASDQNTNNTISLYICTTNSFTEGACTATTLCSQTGVVSNPSCAYQVPAGTLPTSYEAYAFIIDNHGFDPSVINQRDYHVANVAPSILSIVTNGGSEITLSGGEYPNTTNISFVVTVQDNNGCSDLASPTSFVLYRSSVAGGNACTGNVNNCYTGLDDPVQPYNITCSAGASCTGGTDVDAVYTCTAAMQYHTDPTVANTPWAADTWLSYFAIADNAAASASNTATGVNLNMLQALTAGNLSYGTMTAGTFSTTLTDFNTVTNTGNTGLNAEVSSAAPMTSGANNIAVDNQKADPTSGTAWASAAVTLSGTPQTVQIQTPKTTVSGTPQTDAVYWGINIPSGQATGIYTGSTTLAAIYSSAGSW